MKNDIYSYKQKDNGTFGIYVIDEEFDDFLFSVIDELTAIIVTDELNICAGQQYAIGYADGYIECRNHIRKE